MGDSPRHPAYGPQPQSAYSPLTVVCTCFGPTLRVANAFGVVRTAHALPFVAHLTEGAFYWLPLQLPIIPRSQAASDGAPPQSRRLEEATKQAAWGREGPLPL